MQQVESDIDFRFRFRCYMNEPFHVAKFCA